MRNFRYNVLLFLILLFAFNATLMSQAVRQHNPWWVNIGAGPALIGTDFAMNAGIIYCYQFKQSLISARIIGVTNKNPTVQRMDKTTTNYKMTDYGILYGPIWQLEKSYVSLGAGIGLVRAAYETSTSIETNTSIGLPMEVQWFWRPTYFAGIGLYFSTTLNFEKQLTTAMLCVQLGMW
jgi:hypothetical protein